MKIKYDTESLCLLLWQLECQVYRSELPNLGKIQLLNEKLVCFQTGGVLSLIECTLIEEPDASDDDCKSHSITYNYIRMI